MSRFRFVSRLCFLFFILTLGLGGCGGSDETASPAKPLSPPADTEPAPPPDDGNIPPVVITWSDLDEFDIHWGIEGAFTDAATCARCHRAATDSSGILRYPKEAEGADISPYTGWKHSAMAHAFDDPYFQAVIQDETKEFPSEAGTIEDKCLTCHSPMARNYAHNTGLNLSVEDCSLSGGCYGLDQAHEEMMAREGVSCTLCHQVDAANLGTVFSGGFVVDDSALTIFGPYSDPVTGPMMSNTQYTVAGAAHIRDSDLCSVCHNLKTSAVDVNTGQFTGTEFVEQAPYTEWLNSSFNEGDGDDQQCQDCHMPTIAGYQTQLAVRGNGSSNLNWPERSEYSQHLFLGNNNYLLTLLKNYRTELGIVESTTEQGFDDQIIQNLQFMRQLGAEVSIDSVVLANNSLDIDVTVLNKSGHKLPTSYPSRRVWLNLIVKNAAGQVLFESGTPDADGHLIFDETQGSDSCTAVEKTTAYNAARCYGKHLDVIRESHEVAVYESVMGDVNQQVTYVLLYANAYLKDNRIPPVGFRQSGARFNPEVAVVGEALNDSDFNNDGSGEGSGTDTIHYELDWGALPADALQIEARLYYQSIRPAFVEGLHHTGDKIDRFKWMYSQDKSQPDLLASDSQNYSQVP
ncbi:MAG: hypothetical protein ACPGF7_02120 [Pontibacterium sp.]